MKRYALYFVALTFIIFESVWGQTLVSGNVSGTWNLARSPFVVIDNCTVPSGQSLTIEPGVQVIIGKGLKIDVLGQIIAVGTPGQHITIKAPNDTIFWKFIYIQHSTKKSQLKYCDMRNAQRAIYLYIGGVRDTMRTEITNCLFSNCIEAAIYGESFGTRDQFRGGFEPHLAPTVKNCYFSACSIGCMFYIHGSCIYIPMAGTFCGGGSASPKILNNVFWNITDTAFELVVGDVPRPLGSIPIFQNNTVVNAKRGIFVQNPYDATIKNNIFYKAKTGIERQGTTGSLLTYNCFFEKDEKNFIGYPSTTFGNIVMQNRNGDPCDIGFNIFLNPLFADSTNFKLTNLSPCVDAGDPSSERDPDGSIADIGANYFPKTVGVHEDLDLPKNISLFENYPNPFNPETTISYHLPTVSEVELTVYNTLGQKIRTLVNGKQKAAYHVFRWNGKDNAGDKVSSGVYLYRLRVGSFVQTKRMLLLR